MSNTLDLIGMFRGLSRDQAVRLAERLRIVAESARDGELVSAIQTEYEIFQRELYPSRGEGEEF